VKGLKYKEEGAKGGKMYSVRQDSLAVQRVISRRLQ
jgi:hypothetical protein